MTRGTSSALNAGTATLANVSSATATTAIFAANGSATGRIVHNDSTAILYLKFGAGASSTSYTLQMAAGDLYEFPAPVFTGVVEGGWASANGFARTTEITD